MDSRQSALLIFLSTLLVGSTLPAWSEESDKDLPTPTGSLTIQSTIGDNLAARSRTARIRHDGKGPTIALALGGGGARGAAHIGVIRVFEKEHIPIDFIAGTSVGSLIGGLYAAGVPLNDIEEMMLDPHAVFKTFVPSPDVWKYGGLIPIQLGELVGYRPLVGLYAGNKMAKFVDDKVSPERRQIENIQIPFAAITTDLVDGKTYSITQGDLGKAIQASSSLPGLFRPVTYGKKELVDGGLSANLPTGAARDSGADIVIAVNVDESLDSDRKEPLTTVRGLSNRVVSIVLAALDEHQLEKADLEIKPHISDISLYSRKPDDVRRAIETGEAAATEALPLIRAQIAKSAAKSQRP